MLRKSKIPYKSYKNYLRETNVSRDKQKSVILNVVGKKKQKSNQKLNIESRVPPPTYAAVMEQFSPHRMEAVSGNDLALTQVKCIHSDKSKKTKKKQNTEFILHFFGGEGVLFLI